MLKTRKFEVLTYLKTEKDIEEYLNVVLEEGDYKFLPVALADIARARKAMTSAAKAAGVTRTSLYQSLSEDMVSRYTAISGNFCTELNFLF